jgi:hypothetical protein
MLLRVLVVHPQHQLLRAAAAAFDVHPRSGRSAASITGKRTD